MSAITYTITNDGESNVTSITFVFTTPEGVTLHADLSGIKIDAPSDFSGTSITITDLNLSPTLSLTFTVNYTYLNGVIGTYYGLIQVTGINEYGEGIKFIQTELELISPCQPYQVETYPWSTNLPNLDNVDFEYSWDNPGFDGVTMNVNLGGCYESWVGSGLPDDYYTVIVNYGIGYYEYSDWEVTGYAQYYDDYDEQQEIVTDIYYYLTDPTVKSWYTDLVYNPEGLNNPPPGANKYPGVASANPWAGSIQAKNYGLPIIYEQWYSLNMDRTNPLIGYNNYSFIGDGYNSIPEVELRLYGSYVKKYQAGYFKVGADMYNLKDSDFVAGISYVYTDGIAAIKVLVNGISIATVYVNKKIKSFTQAYLLCDPGYGVNFSEMGKYEGYFSEAGIEWKYDDYEEDYLDVYDLWIGDAPERRFNTYQIKYAFIIDTETGGSQEYPIIVYRPPDFSTLPTVNILCAPEIEQPLYIPPPPIHKPLPIPGTGWFREIKSNINQYGQLTANGIVNNHLNEVLVTAYGYSSSTGDNLVLIKFSENGNIVWQKKIDTIVPVYGTSMVVDSTNNLYCIFNDDSGGTTWTTFFKIDVDGNLLNSKILSDPGSPGYGLTASTLINNGNNLFFSGTLYELWNTYYYTSRAYLLKYNNGLEFQWGKKITPGNIDLSINEKGLVTDTDGNLYLAGIARNLANYYDPFLPYIVKIDPDGNQIWCNFYKAVNPNQAAVGQYLYWFGGLAIDSSNNLYTATMINNSTKIKVIKLGADGAIIWQKTISYVTTSYYSAYDTKLLNMCCDTSNNLYIYINRIENLQILKFSSDGDLVWRRFVKLDYDSYNGEDNLSSSDSDTGYSRIVSNNSNFFNVYAGTGSAGYVGQCPINGTETGVLPYSVKYCQDMVPFEDYNPSYFPVSPLKFTIVDGYTFDVAPFPVTLTPYSPTEGASTYTFDESGAIAYDRSVNPGTCTPSPPPMMLTFDTSLGTNTIDLPLDGTVFVTVDWGDGSPLETFTTPTQPTHTYAVAGTYNVTIEGTLTEYSYANYNYVGDNANTLIAINSFGITGLRSLENAFMDTNNLSILPTVLPGGVQNLVGTFKNSSYSGTHISTWYTGYVTDMSYMFDGSDFNQDIGGWQTGSVTSMVGMFKNAQLFNYALNKWPAWQATNMSYMFFGATAFNQLPPTPSSSYGVNISHMFDGATSFNQPLSAWDARYIFNMSYLFSDATSFNQPINNWNVEFCSNMAGMFNGATSFNQFLGSWNTINVTNMSAMFAGAVVFNKPLNGWSTGKVTDMSLMFSGATVFNQPLNNWDTSKVTNMTSMFQDAAAFNRDITSWCVENIPSEPSNFATNCPLVLANKPNWGASCGPPPPPTPVVDFYITPSPYEPPVPPGPPPPWVTTTKFSFINTSTGMISYQWRIYLNGFIQYLPDSTQLDIVDFQFPAAGQWRVTLTASDGVNTYVKESAPFVIFPAYLYFDLMPEIVGAASFSTMGATTTTDPPGSPWYTTMLTKMDCTSSPTPYAPWSVSTANAVWKMNTIIGGFECSEFGYPNNYYNYRKLVKDANPAVIDMRDNGIGSAVGQEYFTFYPLGYPYGGWVCLLFNVSVGEFICSPPPPPQLPAGNYKLPNDDGSISFSPATYKEALDYIYPDYNNPASGPGGKFTFTYTHVSTGASLKYKFNVINPWYGVEYVPLQVPVS